jgi:signal transduction histidine kinase
MEILAWILVVVLAGAVLWLALARRSPPNPYPEHLQRLAGEAEAGRIGRAAAAGEPEEVGRLRRVLADGWAPVPKESPRDPTRAALEGILRYLNERVRPRLDEALALADPEDPLTDALDALEDLAFYSSPERTEEPGRENLAQLVQTVTREYTLETGIPLRVRGPDRAVLFPVRAETFKDLLFLLLANAGRWGEGRTVDLTLAASDGWVRVVVADQGPGFSPEALERAFDPFWSSDPDALGLGLTWARTLARRLGGDVTVGNREGGGGEATLSLPLEAQETGGSR